MQTSFEQAVRMQMRASSKVGLAPAALGSEAAAICAVLERKLAEIEVRLPPKPCNHSYREQPR